MTGPPRHPTDALNDKDEARHLRNAKFCDDPQEKENFLTSGVNVSRSGGGEIGNLHKLYLIV